MATKKKSSTKSRSITLTQAKAIYEGARKSYVNSYAMMVDDIFEGAKAPAKRAGLQVFYDVNWFHLVARGVRAHRSWSSLDESVRTEIRDAMRAEVKKK